MRTGGESAIYDWLVLAAFTHRQVHLGMYSMLHFWPTVLSVATSLVAPLVHCVVCLSSVTFSIVAKWYVVAKNCLKEWIGNQGQKVDFLGRRHISISSFGSTATETAIFALFLPIQPSNRYYMVEIDFLAANHVHIVGLFGQNWNRK